jgi:uncharacterized membrane protein (Fun14 family)
MFSAGGGFLFGTVVGYPNKKVMKIAAIVIGLFVIGRSYLSQRVDRCKMDGNGWKWRMPQMLH